MTFWPEAFFKCVCLTYGASVRPKNAVTHSADNEGQKFVEICLKQLHSRVILRNMSEEANMLLF